MIIHYEFSWNKYIRTSCTSTKLTVVTVPTIQMYALYCSVRIVVFVHSYDEATMDWLIMFHKYLDVYVNHIPYNK